MAFFCFLTKNGEMFFCDSDDFFGSRKQMCCVMIDIMLKLNGNESTYSHTHTSSHFYTMISGYMKISMRCDRRALFVKNPAASV